MDTVCIMMATYNGEKYLSEQIKSIIKQDYSNWVLYISDDDSKDCTVNIINNYVNMYPNKIFNISNGRRKGGAKHNFSYLFENVPEYKYYMFCDQDDYWKPNKISLMLKKIKENERNNKKNNLVYCDAAVGDRNLNIIMESFMKNSKLHYNKNSKNSILVVSFAPGAAMIFDNDLKEIVSKIPIECQMHDWWILMYAVYFGNVSFIDKQLYIYRQHDENVAGSGIDKSLKGISNFLLHSGPIKFLNYTLWSYKHTRDLQFVQTKKFFELEKDNLNCYEFNEMKDFLECSTKISKIEKWRILKNLIFGTTHSYEHYYII